MLKVSHVSIVVAGNTFNIGVKTGVVKITGISTGIVIMLLH